MTEALDKVEDTAIIDKEQNSIEEHIDPDKQYAIDHGWKEGGTLTYREFNLNGKHIGEKIQLNRKLTRTERELSEQKQIIEDLRSLIIDQTKEGYTNARDHYKNIAKTSDDADIVRQAEMEAQKYEEKLRNERLNQPKENTKPTIPEPVQDFLDDHPDWFEGKTDKSRRITRYAHALWQDLVEQNPDMPLKKLLATVEEDIKATFEPTKKTEIIAPTPDPNVGKASTPKTKYDPKSLNEFDRGMYNRLVVTKRIPEEVFFKSLQQARSK